MREVSESMERVIAGPERKGRVMNEKTKHTIAYHESGHALVGHLLDHADPVHKISIISRRPSRWATPFPFPTRTRS